MAKMTNIDKLVYIKRGIGASIETRSRDIGLITNPEIEIEMLRDLLNELEETASELKRLRQTSNPN